MYQSEVKRVLQLIDQWGNETTIEKGGQMSRIKHKKVLAVLEKRALRYKYGGDIRSRIGKRVVTIPSMRQGQCRL